MAWEVNSDNVKWIEEVLYSDSEKPKFCTKCGRALEEKTMVVGYDAYTGAELLQELLLCRTLDIAHDKFKVFDSTIPF